MLGALLPAHRRAALHWAEEHYSHPGNLHGPAAARALAELAATGDPEPLAQHVLAFTANMDALANLLHGLANEFTYDESLRPSMPGTWRVVMNAALGELERDPGLLGYDHWAGTVLGGLLPGPELRLADSNPDATLKRAQENWLAPDTFADLISRWLPLARGYPGAADGLVKLARCGSLQWQVTTGLTWAEELIDGHYAAIAGRCFLMPSWLGEVRLAARPHTEATARWQRIIDGLAAAGDSRAAKLQQAEE
jgi:hypothetical protein